MAAGAAVARRARPVERAERAGAVEPLCEALDLVARCALQDGDLATAGAAFGRAAAVAAEHGLLFQRVEAELGRGLLAQFDGLAARFAGAPRELAVEAGMLADVARIDLLPPTHLAADGPAAAAPLAEASVALAARSGSAPCRPWCNDPGRIRAVQGDVAAVLRLLDAALPSPTARPTRQRTRRRCGGWRRWWRATSRAPTH